MPCAGLGIVIIVMFYPLPRFLAVSVLSLDSYIGFAVPCRFHTIRAVKFSVTVVAYYPAAKRARILEDFPLLAIFFPVRNSADNYFDLVYQSVNDNKK